MNAFFKTGLSFLIAVISINVILAQAISDNNNLSIITENKNDTLNPPINLTGQAFYDDVKLNWDAPAAGGTGEWIQWGDCTDTSNTISPGVSYYVASRWDTADLAPYNGYYLTKIRFFLQENISPSISLKVWKGDNADTLIHSQSVFSMNPGQWNEIELYSPVLIDASQELWFGYKIFSSNYQSYASIDAGPAIQYKGDMISFNGSNWMSISTNYGWDYNWNLAGYVETSIDNSVPIAMVRNNTNNTLVEMQSSSKTGNKINSSFRGKDDSSPGKPFMGYKIYRNGDSIAYTTDTTYYDINIPPGIYNYYVTAIYYEGESNPSNTVTITVIAPNPYCENFDSLTVGGLVADQLGWLWTTWSGTSADDATVSNTYSHSPDNSFVVDAGSVDLVYLLDDEPISNGVWIYHHHMYVPSGHSGYFNVQSEPTPGVDWVIELFFDDGGTGHFAVDWSNTNFTYTQDTWFEVTLIFFLDVDQGLVKFDNQTVLNFETSNSIGGIDYYGNNTGGLPGAYYDDVCFQNGSICPNPPTNFTAEVINDNDIQLTWNAPEAKALLGYNIYRFETNIAFTTDTSYIDLNVAYGEYQYCVSAVYDEGSSIWICDSISCEPQPPKLFSIPNIYFSIGDPIPMSWHSPNYIAPFNGWIHWDDGENADYGIGLTAGGMFYCASRWEPGDLTCYDGMYLTKISYYHYDNGPTATFVLKVWQGANAGTLLISQSVSSTPAQWNEITLDTPVQIDASQELWFGYEVTHDSGENPAGVDVGPAVQYKGDMVSFDASTWVSMSYEYGLDRNWNLAGYVSSSADGKSIAIPLQKKSVSYPSGTIEVASGFGNGTKKFIPSNTKEFSHYNVYRELENDPIGTTTDTTFIDVNYPPSIWHFYYVTAVYDDSLESIPSNTDTAYFATYINEYYTNQIQIYPNPVSDFVNISSELRIERIKVFTNTGQLIINLDVQEHNFKIDMSDFEKGIYLIKVETEDGVIVKQIIKN